MDQVKLSVILIVAVCLSSRNSLIDFSTALETELTNSSSIDKLQNNQACKHCDLHWHDFNSEQNTP